MKKIILPVILLLTTVFFLSPKVDAQTETDCHEAFTKESNACLKENTKCNVECADKARDVMSLKVDGGKVMIECLRSVCDSADKACDDKAMANFRACQDAKEAKAETQTGATKSEAWASIKFREITDGMKQKAGDINNWIEANLGPFEQTVAEIKTEREPVITRDNYNRMMEDAILRAGLHGGSAEFTKQGLLYVEQTDGTWILFSMDEVTVLDNRTGIKTYKIIDEGVGETESKNNNLEGEIGVHLWNEDSGAVIYSPDLGKIKFKEPIEVDGVTSRVAELTEGEVEVKIINDRQTENQFGVDAGWLGVTVSRTHFWVSKDPDKDVIVVGVYEGEVEVKTKDGKTVSVKPDGDQPGVVVISQKLSPVKLGILGLVIAGIIGNIIWFVKRKSSKKKSK